MISGTQGIPGLAPAQRRIITIAWIGYAAYYLGRVNISPAMPDLQADLLLSKGQVGLLSTGFFWAYALGQLINGRLGDALSPRRIVFLGLLASAALNAMFGFLSVWWVMMAIWTLNGYFQATGWGPVLRILANWLSVEQRNRISGLFGSCFVAGNALTWLASGWLVAEMGWRSAFWIPAAGLALTAIGWQLLVRDRPGEIDVSPVKTRIDLAGLFSGLMPLILRFRRLVFSAACLGFVLVSLIVWAPTYMVDAVGMDIGSATTLSALLPVSGLAGVLLTGWAMGKMSAEKKVRSLFMLLTALAAMFVILPGLSFSITTGAVVLVLIGGLVYGASSLQLATLPLILGGDHETSSMGGLVDFSFNIGAGLSGGLVGLLLDASSWNAVFFALAAASLAAALFLGMSSPSVPISQKE